MFECIPDPHHCVSLFIHIKFLIKVSHMEMIDIQRLPNRLHRKHNIKGQLVTTYESKTHDEHPPVS